MSLSEDTNRMLNNVGITANGSVNSESTTGDKHYAKLLNNLQLTSEPDDQATKISAGSPSTTGSNHFQRMENASAGAFGLGGVPKGFTLNGNRSGPNGGKGMPAKGI